MVSYFLKVHCKIGKCAINGKYALSTAFQLVQYLSETVVQFRDLPAVQAVIYLYAADIACQTVHNSEWPWRVCY